MTTGQKIQTLRKQRGLTQEQLAQRLGVSRQAVSRWELDESLPETANLLPLGEVLGVSLDTLLDPAQGLEGPAPKEEPTAPAAPSPADGAGGFCRLGPVAAGQCPLPGADPPGPGALAVLFTVPAPFGDLFPGVGHPVLQAADPPAQIKYPWEAGPINEPQLPRGFFTLLWWRAAPTPGLGTAGPPCRRSPGPRRERGAPRPARRPGW